MAGLLALVTGAGAGREVRTALESFTGLEGVATLVVDEVGCDGGATELVVEGAD